ncbi:S-layer homology domain-containing protein [Paenibacillus sp. IB182496]|uniref:S-layer homology domain-containing protein n=1 Tax=Paenibacillus sabuli TaxID=2772509 RepID=A0A927GRT2_9BACL|nr:S-layer homology domain-containing protein [Paenibacillus sabuli]MBD2845310.1 S-layer homology domain-containing protein [Paenibacillus sabuli]
MTTPIRTKFAWILIVVMIAQALIPIGRGEAEEENGFHWDQQVIDLLSPGEGELHVSWAPYFEHPNVSYTLSLRTGTEWTELAADGHTEWTRWARVGLSDAAAYELTLVATDGDSGEPLSELSRQFTLADLEEQPPFAWDAAPAIEYREDSTVHVQWNANLVPTITHYYVYVFGEGDFFWSSPRRAQGSALSVETPELAPGHYAVWLVAGSTNMVTGIESIVSSHYAVLHVSGEGEPEGDGLPPYWPADAEVALETSSSASLTLGWPQAVDEVASYRVLLDDAERTTVPADTHQVVLDGLISGRQYKISIIAKDTAGASSVPLTGMFQTGSAPLQLQWSAPQTMKGPDRYLIGGSDMQLEMRGDAGYEAEVSVAYQSWLDDAGQLTDQRHARHQSIPVVENPAEPGTYSGVLALEDALAIAEVTGLTGLLHQDGAAHGDPVEVEVGLSVTGRIAIIVQPEGGAISPVSLVLEAGGDRHVQTAPEGGTYTFRDVLPDRSYQATARQVDGGRVLKQWQTAPVQASRVVQETIGGIGNASLQVAVRDHTGQPAPDARVTLMRTDRTSLGRMTTDAQGVAAFDGLPLLEGDQLLASVVQVPAHARNIRDVPVTLQAGLNAIEIALERRPEVRFYGTVVHRTDPLGGFPLVFVQDHPTRPGEKVMQRVTTDATGSYEVYLYAGNVAVEGATTDYKIASMQRQVGAADEEWNFTTGKNDAVEIGYTVHTKIAGGDWVAREGSDMTSQERASYQPFLYDQRGRLIRQGNLYPLSATGEAGDRFQLCMEHTRYNLMSSCQEITVDHMRSGHAAFYMETDGGQVTARLDDVLLGGTWTMTVVDEEGRFNRTYPVPADGRWQEHLPYSGQYVMRLTKRAQVQQQICITCSVMPQPQPPEVSGAQAGESVAIPFVVPLGGGVDLGTLNLSSGDPAPERQGLLIQSAALSPGAVFNLRLALPAAALPSQARQAIGLELPAHTRLVPNSFMLGGEPLDSAQWTLEDEGRLLLVQADALAEGDDLLLHATLELGKDYEAPEAVFRAFLTDSTEPVEHLGQQRLPVRHILMDVPPRTVNPATDVFGWAVPGSTVRVYHNQELLGQTEAVSDGTWSLKVDLPSASTDFIYILSASATLGDQVWMADSKAVWYRENAPHVESVRLSSDGSVNTFYPQTGISRVPYTINYGLLAIDVRFEDPEAVSGVAVRIGGSVLQTVFNAATGYYTAATMVSHQNISRFNGPVYVSYNEVPQSSAAPVAIRTEAELRKALPWWMKDVVLPGEQGVDIARSPQEETRSLNLMIPQLGEQAAAEATITVREDVDYDIAGKPRMSGDGMTIYGYDMEIIKGANYRSPFAEPLTGWRDSRQMLLNYMSQAADPGSSYTIRVTTYQEYDGDQSLAAADAKRSHSVQTLAFPYAKVAAGIIEAEIKAYDHYSTASGSKGFLDLLDSLDKEIEHVYAACGTGAAQGYHSQLENIMEDAMLGEAGKWAAMGAGTAAGALLPGAGLLATGLIFTSTYFYGKIIDKKIQDRIQEVKRNVQQDEECKEDEPEPKPSKPAPEDELVADPQWIFDPSGYVYEAVPGNRLTDVKATLLHDDEDREAWVEWDAQAYGQINPQWTDHAGRYAWDVPQGRWQVRYEKYGYATAYSGELTVLPPHFDVNIPLVSLQPAEVERVYSDDGGRSVTISFTKHMDVALFLLHPPLVRRDDAAIDGAWQPVNAADGEAGQLARRFSLQLAPEEQLRPDDLLQVVINSQVTGYNYLPVSGALEFDVRVTEADEHAPEVPAAVAASAGDRAIYVSWRDPADPDLSGIDVQWRLPGEPSYHSMQVDKNVQYAVINNLLPHTSYELRISASDEQGNRSAYHELTGSAGEAVLYAGELHIPPVAQAAATPRSDRLEVRWQEPPGSQWQEVRVNWRDTLQEGETKGVRVPKGMQNFVITGLSPGRTYEVTLTVEDEAGNESLPVYLNTATTKAAPPAPPLYEAPAPEVEDWIAWKELEAGKALSWSQGELLVRLLHTLPSSTEGGLRIVKREGLARPREERYWAPGYGYELGLSPAGQSDWGGPLLMQFRVMGLPPSVDVHKLGLYRLVDEHSAQWAYVGGVWNASAERLEAQVAQEGLYAVMAFQPTYRDTHNHWAMLAVERLAAHHIIVGVDAERFAPARSITRAEMAALLIRQLERETGETMAVEAGILTGYRDVDADKWHWPILQQAASSGLMTGAGGYLRPDDSLTREEAAVLILRTMELARAGAATEQPGGESLAFTDQADIAQWARQAVHTLADLRVVNGFPDGSFGPQRMLTRAQAASLIWEMYQLQR